MINGRSRIRRKPEKKSKTQPRSSYYNPNNNFEKWDNFDKKSKESEDEIEFEEING